MSHRNRVTPHGEIVAVPLRGRWMGNRGCIHRGTDIVREYAVRRWITCALEHKGWIAPKWAPGRWTALFFHDEAVALAAGHRPCALCRRAAYEAYRDGWEAAFGARLGADDMDRRLHSERTSWPRPARPWSSLPAGTFVDVEGQAALVLDDRVVRWTTDGYGASRPRPSRGEVTVLTPAASVGVLSHGYEPDVDPLVML